MTISLHEDAIVRKYEAGASLRDLAEEYEVSVTPIQRVLRKRGVTSRPTGRRGADQKPRRRRKSRGESAFDEAMRAEIIRRYTAGETQRALAAAFECGEATIARLLREGGVPVGAHGGRRHRHWNWAGGRTMHPSGYMQVHPAPDDDIAQAMKGKRRYVMEHRLVMAHSLGRPLLPTETVHHINGDKMDNRLENLQLRSGRHGNGVALRCRACGSHDIETMSV